MKNKGYMSNQFLALANYLDHLQEIYLNTIQADPESETSTGNRNHCPAEKFDLLVSQINSFLCIFQVYAYFFHHKAIVIPAIRIDRISTE